MTGTSHGDTGARQGVDPASAFATPEAVLADASLDRDQKRSILQQWEYDMLEAEVAQGEGMPAGDTIPDDDADLLRRIKIALDSLA